MSSVLHYLVSNWKWMAPVLGYILLNIANGLTSHPDLANWLHRTVDFITLTTHSDSPGTFKMLFTKSKPPLTKLQPITPTNPTARVAAIIPILFVPSFVLLSSCACWQPEHRNDPGCVIVHQIIDCTGDNLPTSIAGVILAYISGTASPDWNFVLAQLENAGVKDGGCILAQLLNDYAAKPGAAPEKAKAKSMSDMLVSFKAKLGIPDVKYKVSMATGATRLM